MAKWILCVIPWHYVYKGSMVKNKSFPVPSGGECKQICIENVNRPRTALLLNSVVTLMLCTVWKFRIVSHLLNQRDLKEPVSFHNNSKLDNFNSSHCSCDRAFFSLRISQKFGDFLLWHNYCMISHEERIQKRFNLIWVFE